MLDQQEAGGDITILVYNNLGSWISNMLVAIDPLAMKPISPCHTGPLVASPIVPLALLECHWPY